MKRIQTDILVVGSGFGAVAPALRLAERGCRVTIFEKGPHIDVRKDLKQTQNPQYLKKYIKGSGGQNINFTFAEGLGGGSTFYEMVSLRAPSLAFEQVDYTGQRLWPAGLSRSHFDPYYKMGEEMIGVQQIEKDKIPKSGVAFSHLMKNLGYSCDRARYAVRSCIGSGYCISGCIFGGKQSLHLNYLPALYRHNVDVMSTTEVLHIKCRPGDKNNFRDGHSSKVSLSELPFRYEIHARDTHTGEPLVCFAKILILAAGTVGTARILLNSRPYLAHLSHQVGKNIAFNGSVKIVGMIPEGIAEADMWSGMSHSGMISYHFLKSHGVTISCAKPLPVILTSAAQLSLENKQGMPENYWGTSHVSLMKKARRRMLVLYALGLTRDFAEINISASGKVSPELKVTQNLRNYYKRTKSLLESLFTRNGGQVVHAEMVNRKGEPYEDLYFSTSHMTGSCRMAESKEDGVTDKYGEVFGYPGIFVTGGAAVPGSLAVNSSLTILANAERIGDHLVRKYCTSYKS